MYKFTHYGKSGDLIYSLYVVKQLGGGELYITPNKIGMDYYRRLEPLLAVQPYLSHVEYTRDIPEDCIDLNKFRDVGYQKVNTQHIVQSHIDAVQQFYNLHCEFKPEQWLLGVPKTQWKHDYIVIQRSSRYHATFDYRKHIETGLRVLFCGGRDEYEKFRQEYPDLAMEYTFPQDFLEFAKLIRNSKYYIGNQSVGSAIAQGLYHPQIQETHHKEHNCIPAECLRYNVRMEGV